MKQVSAITIAALLMTTSSSIAGSSVQLAGPPWQLETLGGVPVEAANTPSMLISSDGSVNGNGGCNTFSGAATIEGDGLKFERLMSTNRACDQMELERRYFDALALVAGYALEGDKLMLKSADGTEVATLRVVYVN